VSHRSIQRNLLTSLYAQTLPLRSPVEALASFPRSIDSSQLCSRKSCALSPITTVSMEVYRRPSRDHAPDEIDRTEQYLTILQQADALILEGREHRIAANGTDRDEKAPIWIQADSFRSKCEKKPDDEAGLDVDDKRSLRETTSKRSRNRSTDEIATDGPDSPPCATSIAPSALRVDP
jgi:hypothetical protein